MDLSQLTNPVVKKLMRDSHTCPLSALVPSLRKCSHLGDPGRPRRPSFPGSSAGKESACNAGDPSSIPGSERCPGEGMGYLLQCSWTSLVDQTVKNLPAMWQTWIGSLGWEDPLEEGMATHSSILAWEIPGTEEPGGLQSMVAELVTTEHSTGDPEQGSPVPGPGQQITIHSKKSSHGQNLEGMQSPSSSWRAEAAGSDGRPPGRHGFHAFLSKDIYWWGYCDLCANTHDQHLNCGH